MSQKSMRAFQKFLRQLRVLPSVFQPPTFPNSKQRSLRKQANRRVPSIEQFEVRAMMATATAGNDRLYGTSGADSISALQGNDIVYGYAGNDTLNGNEGNDTLYAGDGNDVARGGKDQDVVLGEVGNDTLYGDLGDDSLNGGEGDDVAYGGDGSDVVRGGKGNDRVFGDAGNDTLYGDLGTDSLTGGAGFDQFVFIDEPGTTDTVTDFASGDRLNLNAIPGLTDFGSLQIIADGTHSHIILPGSQGIRVLNYSPAAIVPTMFIGAASIDLRGDNRIDGTDEANTLFGRTGNDQIFGNGGNDTLQGNEGADYLAGGPGNDMVRGGKDADQLYGDDGDDTLRGDLGDDFLQGGPGADSVFGGDGNDVLRGGQNDDQLYGDEGDDTLQGDLGNDFLQGNTGRDQLWGGDGDDVLRGGRDDDQLDGGIGDDILYGDLGNDSLTGGAGADLFIIRRDAGARDVIRDFDPTQPGERIDLGDFTELTSFDAVQIVADASGVTLSLGGDQHVSLLGVSTGQLSSSQFLGPWSNVKTIRVFRVGQLFDKITHPDQGTSVNADQALVNVTRYRIDDFSADNPGNRDRFGDLQFVDLTRFELTAMPVLKSDGQGGTQLDLGCGRTLTIVGVPPQRLSADQFLLVDDAPMQRWIDATKAQWVGEVDVAAVRARGVDELRHDKGVVTYVSRPSNIVLTRRSSFDVNVYSPSSSPTGTPVVEGFANGRIAALDLSRYADVGKDRPLILSHGRDAIVSLGGDQNVLVKDVARSQIPPTAIAGLRDTNDASRMSQIMDSVKLSVTVYGDNAALPTGWRVLQLPQSNSSTKIDATSGNLTGVSGETFHAVAYVNVEQGRIIVAARGTNGLRDVVGPDARLAIAKVASQAEYATQFLDKVTEGVGSMAALKGFTISVTGHSLGAALMQIAAARRGLSSITFENPGTAGVLDQLGIRADPRLHLVINALPNLVNSLDRQLGDVLLVRTAGSLVKDLLPFSTEQFDGFLEQVRERFPALTPLINVFNPASYFALLADTHGKDALASSVQAVYDALEKGRVDEAAAVIEYFTDRQPDNLIEALAYRVIAGRKLPHQLQGTEAAAYEIIKPFLGNEATNAKIANLIPVPRTLLQLDDIVVNSVRSVIGNTVNDIGAIFSDPTTAEGLKNIFSSQSLESLVTAALQGADAGAALGMLRDGIGRHIQSTISSTITTNLKQELFPDVDSAAIAKQLFKSDFIATHAGNLGQLVAAELIQGVATGKLPLDDSVLGDVATQITANYVATEGATLIGQTAGQFIAMAVGAPPIVGQVIGAFAGRVLLNVLGDRVVVELVQIIDAIADVGEAVWKFLGDPINDFSDLWKRANDDKWSEFTGSQYVDIMHHDGDWQVTRLLDGDDVLLGWNGWNKVFGGAGDDLLFGGDGTGGSGGEIRTDQLFGGAGDDYLQGNGYGDDLYGGAGSDWLDGGTGNDTLFGGDDPNNPTREDINTGIDTADTLLGGEGNDRLDGQAGDDVLVPGPGHDMLFGGLGADRFIIDRASGYVVLNDFEPGRDKIDLRSFGPGVRYQVSFGTGSIWTFTGSGRNQAFQNIAGWQIQIADGPKLFAPARSDLTSQSFGTSAFIVAM